jgi:hypothetical protein
VSTRVQDMKTRIGSQKTFSDLALRCFTFFGLSKWSCSPPPDADEKAESFSPVPQTGRETRRLPNGTLHFSSVEEHHAGFYSCEAANGIGLDISKVIQVIVQRESDSAFSPICHRRNFSYSPLLSWHTNLLVYMAYTLLPWYN